jgi:hypothetical protein
MQTPDATLISVACLVDDEGGFFFFFFFFGEFAKFRVKFCYKNPLFTTAKKKNCISKFCFSKED